jgi:SynChlorMet cassette radical SAM/SPASM protein ScmF
MTCEIEKSTIEAAEQVTRKLDLPEGVPPLTSLYMYISGSCNLACRHCWIKPEFQAGGNGGQHIPVEYVRKAVREAKPLGLCSVKLTGGEPTLHPRFRDIVKLIDDEGLATIIETNGTLVNDSLAAFLKQAQHVPFISVSLDGTDAKTHDALRGVEGSFKRALAGIESLVNVGFHPQMISTLHKGNISQMGDLVALAESSGCGSVKFNLVQGLGRGELFARDQGLEIDTIVKLHRRVKDEISALNKISIYFDIPLAFYPIRDLLKDNLSKCKVKNILGLLSGGQLSLCGIGVTVPELIYGHIKQDNLHDIWCNCPGLIQLREQIPKQFEGICGKCIHRDMCNGACVASNYHISGKLNGSYAFCERAELIDLFPASRKK